MKLSHLVLSNSKVRFVVTRMTMMFLSQSLLSSVASASPQQPAPKSFEAWCRQRNSVPMDTRHTIDVLLEKAGTKDCKLADRQLKTLTFLDLSFSEIIDVKPLAGLTNLTVLQLSSNEIRDIKPLTGLINLTNLDLGNNQISDVKLLVRLTKLTTLWLRGCFPSLVCYQ
jgi:internalin A